MSLTRAMAVSELTMHKFATVVNHLVHHHAQLKIKFEHLAANVRSTYTVWTKAAQDYTTNAVGMNCLNCLVKYRNMLQVIEQGRTSGGPSWSVETHPKGKLHMVFDKAERPYIEPQQGLKHLGVIRNAVRYLDDRSKGTNPGENHLAVAGL